MKNFVNVNAVQYNIYVISLGKTFAIAALKCKMMGNKKLDKQYSTLTKLYAEHKLSHKLSHQRT